MSKVTPVGYYNTYDPSTKSWKMVLFNPGVPIQSSELNGLQAILHEGIRGVASSLFRDGAVISGGQFSISGTTASVGESEIYSGGFIHRVPAGSVTITGVGTERVGLRITQYAITEVDDTDLLNPAVGSEGYQQPGAHRLDFIYTWVLNDDNAVVIMEIIDGQINQVYSQARPVIDTVLGILATRTYDESGSYRVNDFMLTFDNYELTNAKYNSDILMKIRGGDGYVRGWHVVNSAYTMDVDRPVTTASRFSEPEGYVTGTVVYNLSYSPVRSITTIEATVLTSAIEMNHTGGPPNYQDEIPIQFQPVVSVIVVYDGTHVEGSPYEQGVDYTLEQDRYINWSLGHAAGAGHFPVGQYFTKVHYTKQMVKGVRRATVVTGESVTRGGGSTDTLAHADMVLVSRVYQGGTTYVLTADYTINLITGVISWAPGGAEPTGSSTYNIDYIYWSHTVEGDFLGRDSFRNQDGSVILYDGTKALTLGSVAVNYKAQFSFDTTGDKPVNGTTVQIDYEYTLGRIDTLVIDYRGIFSILQGLPALNPVPIGTADINILPIARLNLIPEARAKDVVVQVFDNQRLTMIQLRTMLREIHKLQFNDAVFQLHQDALNVPTATDKNGVFADRFVDLTVADYGHADFNGTLDPLAQRWLLPQLEDFEGFTAGGTTDAQLNSNFYTLPWTHFLLMSQPYATDVMQVNAFTQVNLGAQILITPAQDTWIDTTISEYVQEGRIITLPPRTVRHLTLLAFAHGNITGNPGDVVTLPNGIQATIVPKPEWQSILDAQQQQGILTVPVSDNWSIESVADITTLLQKVTITPLAYARQITVTINGKRFTGDEDNIALFFDGKFLPVAASAPNTGTNEGTAKADANGIFSCTFDVPNKVLAGSHRLQMAGQSAGYAGGPGAGSRASTFFYSQGKHEQIDSYITVDHVIRPVHTVEEVRAVDPVAQSYQLGAPAFITKITLFFKKKPVSSAEPVQVIITDLVNGFPGTTQLGMVELPVGSINVSNDASVGTDFVFPNPVFNADNKEYAFIVATDSEQYELHISRVGGLDPVNGWVNKNPNTGVLFRSANRTSWSVEQGADIKFTMYRALFSPSVATVDFGTVSVTSKGMFEFAGIVGNPNITTKVEFLYSTDGGTVWHTFTPVIETQMDNLYNSVKFKAKLYGNERLSPVLYKEAIGRFLSWDSPGAYVSRTITMPDDIIGYVDLWLDVSIPSGTTVVPQLNFFDGNGWQNIPDTSEDLPISTGVVQKHYLFDTHTAEQDQIAIKINLTSNSFYTTPWISRLRLVTREI